MLEAPQLVDVSVLAQAGQITEPYQYLIVAGLVLGTAAFIAFLIYNRSRTPFEYPPGYWDQFYEAHPNARPKQK
ncbi:hypothetical protein A2866_01410 [Candidatus Roizmanbacteria bacterium RIFCSPHIGHO2_01_FULL_39_8]|uniref:Uncharacterized protein n=2 Tax=Candidatus Roizmaniibacteriota TaxID=1752723 RepID=A0A1F7GKL6_9BACT|nr:MAG: hypothetical protein A2866_01410 [Candidatus Roizmanbacteria bacterium RIFCSPHIGHO2_01_FULL_39_8]OGK28204.1 MAG: hypothetical protein A3C28_03360 [Candidatus Roizmanbacteria bacterium RIFCSPHIGHO2_02_FULL_39_9]